MGGTCFRASRASRHDPVAASAPSSAFHTARLGGAPDAVTSSKTSRTCSPIAAVFREAVVQLQVRETAGPGAGCSWACKLCDW